MDRDWSIEDQRVKEELLAIDGYQRKGKKSLILEDNMSRKFSMPSVWPHTYTYLGDTNAIKGVINNNINMRKEVLRDKHFLQWQIN